ncbi:efflux RND transporter periplasmic adaptor subunit [Algicella marina]|uniref:Efflux RND transporter periplasmic adaptor subunit n=1 Tax=Algicella marina TaxID=2683284 RepID=A0A6P1T0F5_9RHOB|nr:efflux RND transporter periplasmic adaptor subunit [Algicella marina]QHQ34769.1 efflux RND transporter periplasmic adaptor subunit [Algicella marina]
MRILSFLTACLVALFLYAVIMERDALRALAGNTDEVELAQADTSGEASADQVTGAVAGGPVRVVVQVSEAEPVQSGLVLAGRTEAARKVEVKAETAGLVVSEPLQKGATVQAGELMCKLDAGTREASLAEARARQIEAETNFETATKLSERGFQSETSAIAAKAGLESAMAMVSQAEKEIERLEIRAPFNGILESDTAELGALLQPGASCGTLIALDPIKLVGYVPETEVEKLKLGAQAGGRLSTGRDVTGTVSFVSRSADPLTRTFQVEVDVPNSDGSIRDGISVDILIGLEAGQGHLLPQSALTLNDDGALGVRLNDNGVARFAPVTILRDSAEGMWLAGLPDRAEVIVVGQDFVVDGRAITPSYRSAEEPTQ